MTTQEAINVFKELLSVPKEMIIKYDSVANEEQKVKLNKIYTAQQMAIEALEKQLKSKWIPTVECLPRDDRYVLLSFANFTLPMVGRYKEHEDGSGNFYLGDCDEEDTCLANDLIVNAWMPLPEPYREDDES